MASCSDEDPDITGEDGGDGLIMDQQDQVHTPDDGEQNTEAITEETLTAMSGLSKRAQKRMIRNQRNKEKRKAMRKESPVQKNTNPGFSPEYFGLTDYYFENGLRKVYPYYYTFECYIKGRWIDQPLTKVLEEFQSDLVTESVDEIMANGGVFLNGEVVRSDRILKNQDYLGQRIHRHENPIVETPLDIVADDENVIAINKPSSIPVHPCGRYRFNSVPFILGKELGYTNLRTIYRLDRLTSGLLILAKSATKTREMEDDIMHRRVQKEYVARVIGKFPDGQVECDQRLGVLSNKYSLYGVVPNGKPSKTVFERLSYNGTTSVVRCFPQTGRTHQIRLHLQYLGYPILNDPLYNDCFGPNKGKGGILEKTLSEIIESIRQNHNVGLWVTGDNPDFQKRMEEVRAQTQPMQNEDTDSKQSDDQALSHIQESNCSKNCQEQDCITKLNDAEKGFHCEEEVSDSDQSHEKVSDLHQFLEKASDVHQCEVKGSNLHQCVVETVESRPKSSQSAEEPMRKKPRLENDNTGDDTSTEKTVPSTSHQCGDRVKSKVSKCPEFNREKWIPDEKCHFCKKTFLDPSPSDLVMYLHALKYTGPKWKYETPLPEWAREDWKEPS